MYLLFRYHHIIPSQYKDMGRGEQRILKAFVHFQVEKTNEEYEKMKG